MKLSVVMPCYNKATYLIAMVETIINQTFKDWELIIVDDGSDDANFSKISSFVSSDDRINLVRRNRQPKNGDTCRNIGIDMSRGEYLIIFDSDDLVSETCFERRVNYMDTHPEIDYATFPTSSFIEGTNNKKPRKYDTETSDLLGKILYADYPFTVWANIYRRSSLADVRWDERVFLYQDFDFMVQCELKGLVHGWAHDKEDADYYYRVFKNGNSVCQKVVSEQKVESSNYLFNKIYNQIISLNDKDRLVKCFFRFIVLHYEQLLLAYNKQYVSSFLETVYRLYPNEYDLMVKIAYWREQNSGSSHFTIARLYSKLYHSFRFSIYKSFMIHEYAKWVLMVK